jgi:glycosyltransferase involved in cell wall biosynthesis/SAM-dependent methyltransferase
VTRERPLHLLYLSPEFPKVRHGFQAVEICELARTCRVTVLSLRPPTTDALAWLERGFPDCRAELRAVSPQSALAGLAWAVVTRPAELARSLRELAPFLRVDLRGGVKALAAGALGGAVARTAIRSGADWIHADFASAPATAGMVAATLARRPWSFTGRAFDVFSTRPAGRATRPLLRLKIARADAVLAENSAAAKVLEDLGARRCVLKRNGVRVPEALPARAHANGPAVVGLGALEPKKGFDTLVDAVALLRARLPAVSLILHGDGPEAGPLADRARAAGVDLRLPGAYAHDRLATILAEADVVAVPSRRLASGDSDGVPTVLIEALAHGAPVVGADVGAVRDLVRDGDTGFLVPPDDAQRLAGALERMLTDRHVSAELARAGRRLVEREFTVERAAEVLLEEISRPRQRAPRWEAVPLRPRMRELSKGVVFRSRALLYAGDARECPCCGGTFRTFLAARVDGRPDAICPRCGSAERHRLLWLYLERETDLWRAPSRVLHLAPERALGAALAAAPAIEHVAGDISGLGGTRLDVTNLPFPDESFDVVLCSHVLEHVPDDRRALAELRRVLRGWGVLQVPVKGESTDEDPSVTDRSERLSRYGQHDHVRQYGLDFEHRLRDAGFAVDAVRYADRFSPELVERYRLDPDEHLYVVRP